MIVACAILKEPYIRNYGKMNDVYAQSLSFVLERAVFYLDSVKEDEEVELHTVVEMRGKKKMKNYVHSICSSWIKEHIGLVQND